MWRCLVVCPLLAGCLVDVSFDGTSFRCERSNDCPDGFECVEQVCRDTAIGVPDAGVDAFADCPDADVDGAITALRADGAPVIDGVLEAAWASARAVSFENSAQSDNTARVSLLWDDDNLYFAFEVTDAQLEAISEPDRIFRDDGSEIYLDMEHDETTSLDEDDAHYIINILDVVQSGTLTVATQTSAGSYVMEHALAWTEVGATPVAGQTVGLLLGNNDRDNDASAQYDWRGLIDSGSYARPNLWGDLHFSDVLADGRCGP